MTAKTTTQKTNQQTEQGPGKAVEPYWQDLFKRAQTATTEAVPYAGRLIADPTLAQRTAVDWLKGVAPTLSAGATPLTTMANRIAGGEFLDVANNPYFQGSADAISRGVGRALTREWLPAATDEAVKLGAYGGSGSEEMAKRLTGEAAGRVADSTANLATQFYNTGAQMLPLAPGFYTSANALAGAPAQVLGAAGTQEQAWDQAKLDEAFKLWEMQQAGLGSEAASIDQMAKLLNMANYRSGTMTGVTETTTPPPDMATMILQGGLGALGMLSGFGTAMPGITAGAKGLGSIFSGLGGIFGGGAPAAAAAPAGMYPSLWERGW